MKAEFHPWLGWARRGGWASLDLLPRLGVGWGLSHDMMTRTGHRWFSVRLAWLAFHVDVQFEGRERRDLYVEYRGSGPLRTVRA